MYTKKMSPRTLTTHTEKEPKFAFLSDAFLNNTITANNTGQVKLHKQMKDSVSVTIILNSGGIEMWKAKTFPHFNAATATKIRLTDF